MELVKINSFNNSGSILRFSLSERIRYSPSAEYGLLFPDALTTITGLLSINSILMLGITTGFILLAIACDKSSIVLLPISCPITSPCLLYQT